MRASVLGILQRVLQAYSSPLSTLLSAQEPGLCGHQQDLFLGSTSRRLEMVEQPWARGCLSLLTEGLRSACITPKLLFPDPGPFPGPLWSRGANGAPLLPALECHTSPRGFPAPCPLH